MAQAMKLPEPTIWALRKNNKEDETIVEGAPSLYEHLYGYEPIRVVRNSIANQEFIRRGSAENPALNIINPQTNFAVMEIAADLPPEEA